MQYLLRLIWDFMIQRLKKWLFVDTATTQHTVPFQEDWRAAAIYPDTGDIFIPEAAVRKMVTRYKFLFPDEVVCEMEWQLQLLVDREVSRLDPLLDPSIFNGYLRLPSFIGLENLDELSHSTRGFPEMCEAFKRHQVLTVLMLLSRGAVEMASLPPDLIAAVVMHEHEA